MKYMRNTEAERGSISMFASIVMSGIIILNVILFDYASLKYQLAVDSNELKLACNSVLANYDTLLSEKYGIYGYNEGGGRMPGDDFRKYFKATSFDIKTADSLTETDILKKQITGIMKFKTPVNMTEAVLNALGFLSDCSYSTGDYGICARAAEKLPELQKTQNQLDIKLNGLFKGDTACVNGYVYSLQADIFSALLMHETETETLLNQLLGLTEQYLNYNMEAAALCRELEIGKNEINDCLAGITGSSGAYSDAQNILSQARSLGSGAAYKKINANINAFSNRMALINAALSGDFIDINAFKSAFIENNIDSDIHIGKIYSESGGESHDVRNEIYGEIDRLSKTDRNNDTYTMPADEYKSMPSVRAGLGGTAEAGIFSAALDSFKDFYKIIEDAKGMSFNEAVRASAESILIDDYIITYMTSRMDGVSDKKINNEIEYILSGSSSAGSNNKNVENKILLIRFIINFINIIRDPVRNAEAEAAARAIAALLSLGAGTAIYKYIIIAGWSVIDSYKDLERLLSGEAVPVITLGQDSALDKFQNYSFYLKILLLLEPENTKLMRICDMIEYNMREYTGTSFKLSGIYTSLSVSAEVKAELIFVPAVFGKKLYMEEVCEVSYNQ